MENITKSAQEGDQVIEEEEMHAQDIEIYLSNPLDVASKKDERLVRLPIEYGNPDQIFHYAGWWWSLLNMFSITPVVIGIAYMVARWIYTEDDDINNCMMYIVAFALPVIILDYLFMFVVLLKYRGAQNRLVGRLGKLLIDVIAICVALMLRWCVPFDFGESSIFALAFMISLTMHIHSWAQLLHLAGDISLNDVLAEIVMGVLIYIVPTALCFFLFFSFCGLLCFNYCSYSAPKMFEDTKKDFESLPC